VDGIWWAGLALLAVAFVLVVRRVNRPVDDSEPDDAAADGDKAAVDNARVATGSA
jgi:hypothetical protein